MNKIKRTKAQRDAAREKKAIVVDTQTLYVSDHALWRYAERHMGFPKLEDIRRKIREDLATVSTLAGLEALGFRIRGKTICTYGQVIRPEST